MSSNFDQSPDMPQSTEPTLALADDLIDDLDDASDDVEDETPAEPELTFASVGLDADLVKKLASLGYSEPTPIQAQAIPPLLAGRDVVGQAATGTGKTAAFTLPILHRLGTGPKKGTPPSALILVPTRELATQVAAAVMTYGGARGVRVLAIYGGQPYEAQLRGLHRGVDVVVATPGRALDHMERRSLDLSAIKTVVLDEADEMLAMGFIDDIETILEAIPATRQVALLSATMPERIANVARRHLKDPVRVTIARPSLADGAVSSVRQTAYVVPRVHKLAALQRVLDFEKPTAAIIFCRTRLETDEVTSALNARGHRAEALHGGMSQQQRDRVMKKLRDNEAKLVVATDIAARGLDIDQLSHVFNFDVPASPETYVHRIGRVGRAGRAGVAITMAEPRHRMKMRDLERITRQNIYPARVPSLADIEAKRLTEFTEEIRKTVAEGKLDLYKAAVATLATELDPVDIAAAAFKLAGGAAAADDEPIMDMLDNKGGQGRPKDSVPMARLFVNAGRAAGIRPGDLVGAIAGEARINGRDIGAIRVEGRHSIVEIRADLIDRVVAALPDFKIKGQAVAVRKDRDGAPAPREGRDAPREGRLPPAPFARSGAGPRGGSGKGAMPWKKNRR